MPRRLRLYAALAAVLAVAWCAGRSRASKMETLLEQEVTQVPPPPPGFIPTKRPVPSQEAIQLALTIYDIEIPAGFGVPQFDARLEYRGLIDLNTKEVKIGPGAFESWGWLGATLAHELEIHANQESRIRTLLFFRIVAAPLAEREAYSHEIRSAGRFGLSRSDVAGLAATRDFFYPHVQGKLGAQ